MLGLVLVAAGALASVEGAAHSALAPSSAKVEWTADLEQGLERASEEGRVVVIALGVVGEARSDRHIKELYSNKKLSGYFKEAVNIPAWSYSIEEERALPRFSKVEPEDHVNNLIVTSERWLKPNSEGVVPLPQHLWLSPGGELLLSCPYEIEVEEFAWCFDEALRRAGVEERPAPLKGAHPPRRLLLGDVLALGDEDDLGRGLKGDELDVLLKAMNKRFLTERDRGDVIRVLFTDEESAVSFQSELPQPLQQAMVAFIERCPNWDQYRLVQAALAGFLIQHGVESREITRLYVGNMFRRESLTQGV